MVPQLVGILAGNVEQFPRPRESVGPWPSSCRGSLVPLLSPLPIGSAGQLVVGTRTTEGGMFPMRAFRPKPKNDPDSRSSLNFRTEEEIAKSFPATNTQASERAKINCRGCTYQRKTSLPNVPTSSHLASKNNISIAISLLSSSIAWLCILTNASNAIETRNPSSGRACTWTSP